MKKQVISHEASSSNHVVRKRASSLQTFIHAGKANARTFTRARVLLKAARSAGPRPKSAKRSTSVATPPFACGSPTSKADWRPCCTTSGNSDIVTP
jgi:hypothetical protein